MGATCNSCNTCSDYGDNAFEFVLGGFYLHKFQNQKISINNLDKYDQFYRIVCDPFPRMKLSNFINDIDALAEKCEKSFEEKYPEKRYNLDMIPYVSFIEHFKD